MYLIDDIDLVFALVGCESSLFDQITDIVDAIVRGPIDLDTIEHIPIIECDTVCTGMTGISVFLEIETVDSFCEDPSTRRLPGSSRTREDVGVSDTIGRERGTENG